VLVILFALNNHAVFPFNFLSAAFSSRFCTLNIRFFLHPVHSAALSDFIDSHHPDIFFLTETWIKCDTTPAELINCTPPSYSHLSFPRNSSANRHHPTGGGTAFLIHEPFAQLSSFTPQFSSFEASSVILKLPRAKISVFNIYRSSSFLICIYRQ